MSIKNSNLYAEKIYSEHPLALWTLDDDISFLQLFSDSEQNLSNENEWELTNLIKEDIVEYETIPIRESSQSRFSSSSAKSSGNFVVCANTLASADEQILLFKSLESQSITQIGNSVNGVLTCIKYANDKFVTLESFTGNIFYSSDGETWQQTNIGTFANQPWWDLEYGNGIFLATGGSVTKISSDGITWPSASASTLPSSHYYFSTIFYNNKFIGTGYRLSGTPVVSISTDGISWSEHSLPTSKTGEKVIIGQGNGNIITFIQNTREGFISTNGTSWSTCTVPSTVTPAAWENIVYGNGTFIISSESNNYLTSSDGVIWVERDFGHTMNFGRTLTFVDVENKFYGVSQYDNKIYYSSDGITWGAADVVGNGQYVYHQMAVKEIIPGTQEYDEKLTSEISKKIPVSSSASFSTNISTACFSLHLYQSSIYTSYYDIGIRYDDQEEYTRFHFGSSIGWQKLSHTFNIPDNKNISFFLRVKFVDNYLSTESDYAFQINGVSLGQWSELYNSDSIGFNDIELPSEIRHVVSSSSSYTCTVADAYGLDDSLNGYYLIKDKQIYAENSGLPLVFGSQNSTKITQAGNNNPSIILPGMGFLNEAGRYNSYTLEAWIRLQNLSADKIKIIGPIFSEDGIYIEEGYLSVVIGDQCIKSYFVGKWYRPMLIHFKYNQNYVSVYINGEQVISENIDIENISLPEYDSGGEVKDWIGIYGNSLVDPFEIDCISILPYDLPLEMAKRRFVYGQGVGDFELSNSIYKNETIFFDYANSEYATNLIYPDMNRWKDALAVNLDTSSSYITPIDYDLPAFQSRSSSLYIDWLEGNRLENINNPDAFDYFVMKPNSASTILEPSLFYENINIINENLNSVVAVFKPSNTVETEQPLMVFNNKSTLESLRIIVEPFSLIIDGGTSNTISFDTEEYYGSASTQVFTETDDFGASISSTQIDTFSLKYIYKNYIEEETTIYEELISASANFTAGINIESLKNNNFSTIGNFFSSLDNVSLTIGKLDSNNFEGKIYAIHFANSFTYEKYLSNLFENGIALQEISGSPTFNTLINHTSTYSLLPISDDCGFTLDIGIFGYWEDMQPLSYFGKYVYDQNGNQYYDLDLLQINIDSPSSYIPQENEETSIKSFVTFKHFTDATNKQYSSFINAESLSSNSIVEFNGGQYDDTKYEFNDKTVIIPPDEDFENYYLGIHLEIKVRGIKTKSFLIRRIELASLAFNDNIPTKIGSRYAEYVYPFTRTGNVFNYKEANPLTIYKDTSPFLYLTDDSGLFCNVFDVGASATRGFYNTVNQNENDNYILGALQTWIRYPSSTIGNENIPLMSIVQNTASVNFYIEPEDGGKRGFVYAYDSNTGLKIDNIVFFQDGKIVDNPIIYPQRWTSINTSFLDPLEFNNYAGRIEFYEGILFNNISKYIYSNNTVNTFKEIFFDWYQIFYNEENYPEINTWAEIKTPAGQTGALSWRQATAHLQSNAYTIDGQQIYNNQTGLSISVTDDTSRLNIYSNGSDIMTEVIWQTFEKSPV